MKKSDRHHFEFECKSLYYTEFERQICSRYELGLAYSSDFTLIEPDSMEEINIIASDGDIKCIVIAHKKKDSEDTYCVSVTPIG